MDANTRQYGRFNAIGRQLTVRLIPPSDNTNPIEYFLTNVKDLIEHALRVVDDSDVVGMNIQKEVNQNDKHIVVIFRRRDQLSADVIWSVF